MGLLGLDEFYDNLLNEAKSPEEMKKILTYQYVENKNVPQEVLDQVFDIDPTKKKSYTRWTLNQWEKYSKQILNALKTDDLSKMFQYYKEHASATDGTALNLTDMPDFKDALNVLPDKDPIFGEVSDNPKAEDYDIVYDSPEWRIAVPHTFEADKKLGRGCHWCTAGAFRDDDYYWNSYSKYGPLWVNYDKRQGENGHEDRIPYPYKRYQFLFEYNDWGGEFCDVHDNHVDPSRLNMPEDVIKFYYSQNRNYGDICMGRDVKNAELNEFKDFRAEHQITLKTLSDGEVISIKLGPSLQDYRAGNYKYFVFSSRDDNDPIINLEEENEVDPENYNPGEIANALNSFQNMVAVKHKNGSVHIYFLEDESLETKDIKDDSFLPLQDKVILFYGARSLESGQKAWFRLYDDNEALYSFKGIKDVENIQLVKNNTLENGMYAIDFATNNGSHILLQIQENCIVEALSNDMPANGKFYEIQQEGGKYFVNGQHFKHWLFGANNMFARNSSPESAEDFSGENCHITEQLTNALYIVSSDNGLYHNLYDKESKRFLSKIWFSKILHDKQGATIPQNLVVCTLDGDIFNVKKALFDVVQMQFVTPILDKGRLCNDSYFIGFSNGGNTVSLYDFETKRTYTADGVAEVYPVSNYTKNFVIVKNSNSLFHTWFFRQGKFGLESVKCTRISTDPVSKFNINGQTDYLFEIIITENENSSREVHCLADLDMDNIVLKDVGRIDFSPNEQWINIPYKNAEGENVSAVIDNNGNVLLSSSKFSNATRDYLVALDNKTNKVLCYDDNCQLQRSIDCPQDVNSLSTDYHSNSISFNFPDGYITYSIDNNSIIGFKGFNSEEEAKEKLFSQAQAIRENFKSLYKRLFE